jgi:8-oxo-dGTP pyrophosphatase MutT (NUDIX family)
VSTDSSPRSRSRVVSAGGVVYRWCDDRIEVVLAGRRRGRGRMVWSIPKGHVEAGESTRQTAVREVREETGITGEIEAELGEIRYTYAVHGSAGRGRVSKQVHFFLMRAVGGRFEDRDTEMDEVRWESIEGAEVAMTYENERALVRRARALLARDAGTR